MLTLEEFRAELFSAFADKNDEVDLINFAAFWVWPNWRGEFKRPNTAVGTAVQCHNALLDV